MAISKKDLQDVAKELASLLKKVENMQKRLGESSPAKAAAKKAPPKAKSASATVLSIVNRSKKGITPAAVMAKTGFGAKKVQNILFEAKKKGKVKTISRGIYLKA
jgi:predicted Rossmann fold nucleotide-binding protein DprA/Smf involved in DNA uptake